MRKFNLSSEAIGSASTATLRLYVDLVGNSEADPNNLQLFRLNDDNWAEGTITWNNRPHWDPLYIEQKFDPVLLLPKGSYLR